MSTQASMSQPTPSGSTRKDVPTPKSTIAGAIEQPAHLPGATEMSTRNGAHTLQRTYGNQAIGRALNATKGDAATDAPVTAERHASVVDSIVSRIANYQDARKAQSAPPVVAPISGSAPRVQRLVMSNAEWKSRSSKVGKMRSTKLLDIDEALEKYNAGQQQSLQTRLNLLNDITAKITVWENTKKKDKNGDIKSARSAPISKLKNAINEELLELTGKAAASQSASPQDVVDSGEELYKRATHEMRATLSLNPKKRKEAKLSPGLGNWPALKGEAAQLTARAAALGLVQSQGDLAADAARGNAVLCATGVNAAIEAFDIIVARFIYENNTGIFSIQSLVTQLGKFDTCEQALDSQNDNAGATAIKKSLQRMNQNVKDFAGLAGIDLSAVKDDGGGVRDLKQEEPEGWQPVETLLGFLEQGGTFTTFYGGTDNSGFGEFYMPKPEEGADTRTESQKSIANFFGGMDPGDTAGQDAMWGGGDIAGGIINTFTGGKSIYDAIMVLRDPKASKDDKRKAKQALAKEGVGTVSAFLRFVGGAMTAHRAGKQWSQDADTGEMTKGILGESGFGFSSGKGADVSTDIKMVSDWAGVFTGVISVFTELYELFKWMTGEGKEEFTGGGWRQKIEVVGTGLSKFAGIVSTGASAYSSGARLVMQIQGGGVADATAQQMTTSGMAGGAGAGAVPIIGLIVSVMGAIKNAYKMVRLGIRKYDIKKKLKEMYADRKKLDLDAAEAVEMVDTTLFKRLVRVGIELGHNIAQIGGGAATVSGMGSAVGMSISLASTAGKFGQVGLRVGKQKARNRKAKQRADKKDPVKAAESYAQWKRRKQKEAGDEHWKRFWAGVDIQFTPNWDKSSNAKGMERREAALKIVEMGEDDMTVFHGLGIHSHHLKGKEIGEKVQLVVEALNKRD